MHCDVIKDLLPLYQEGIISEESKKLVAAHLESCPACRQLLAEMKEGILPAGEESLPLEKISRGIKRRRWRAALMAVCLVLAVATAVLSALTTPRYIPYEEGLVSIREISVASLLEGEMTEEKMDLLASAGLIHEVILSNMDDEGKESLSHIFAQRYGKSGEEMPETLLEITLPAGYYASLSSQGQIDPEAKSLRIYDLQVYTYPLNRMPPQTKTTMIVTVEPGMKAAVYYLEPGKNNRLIYGPNPYPDGGVMTLPRLALAYYFKLALFTSLVLAVLSFIFRKNGKAQNVLLALLGLPLSWLIAQLMIKGGVSASFELARDFLLILITTLFLYIAWLLFLARRREKRLENA